MYIQCKIQETLMIYEIYSWDFLQVRKSKHKLPLTYTNYLLHTLPALLDKWPWKFFFLLLNYLGFKSSFFSPFKLWNYTPSYSGLLPILVLICRLNSCEKMFCVNRVYIFLWNVLLQHFLISETHLQHIYDLGFYPQGLIGGGVSGDLKRKLFPVASIG